MSRNYTTLTSADEIGCALLTPSATPVTLTAILATSAAGQTANLELYNLTDGVSLTTITTTNTTDTKVTSGAITVALTEKMYSLRLSRTGGTSQQAATCKMARIA